MKKILFVLIFGLGLVAFPVKAQSATYTVTKTADTNDGTCDADCSLREAVVAANANSGADTIEFSIPTSDGGYVAASGSTQAYWLSTLTTVLTLSDDSGVTINGYSQTGSSRNTAAFGDTINTVLTIQIFFNTAVLGFNLTGDNNHLAGLNIRTTRDNTGSIGVNTSSSNWFEGNFFGSNITGTAASNGGSFELENNSSDNIFGTDGDGSGDVGERNLFMSNQRSNSRGHITSISGNGTVIAGNYFGVDKTSRVCTNATLVASVVTFSAGTGHRVGTNYDGVSDSDESNILACVNSTFRGELRIAGITSSVIHGNYIGTNTYGDDFNTLTDRPGFVFRDTASSGVTVKGNTIKNNTTKGIEVASSASYTGLTFRENIIYNNGGVDIDLGANGITANDTGDTDTGPNDLMNFPVITEASYSGGNRYHIYGTLDGKASEAPFTIEVCKSSESSLGYGGCTASLGTTTINSSGSWDLEVTVSGDDASHHSSFSALATNVNGSTSEFGLNTATNLPPVVASSPAPDIQSTGQGGAVTENGVVSVVPANTFKYDAYLSVETAVQQGSFRIPGTLYWQTSPVYNIWWKAFANDAKILPAEVRKPFIISLRYLPSSILPKLSEKYLRLAYSVDGKKWKVLPNSILDQVNHTMSLVTKQGGYYMLISRGR